MVTGKTEDKATFTANRETLQVQIYSTMGIGNATLAMNSKKVEWPDQVEFQLTHINGDPLKDLEQVTITGEGFRISGSRRTSGKMEYTDLRQGADAAPRPVNVQVERTETTLRVLVPGKLLSESPTIHIQWIDFFRD